MTARRYIDRDAIIAELRPIDVIRHYNIPGKRQGSEFRSYFCPMCGAHSRDPVCINLRTGLWIDFAGECQGDLLTLIAAEEQLDVRIDFGRILEIAAQIAGIGPNFDPVMAAKRRKKRWRAERKQARSEAEARARAISEVPTEWSYLHRSSDDAEQYLAGRLRADPGPLIEADLVRFCGQDIMVLLHAFEGHPVNIVMRQRTHPFAPKVMGRTWCPTLGTLVGRLGDIGERSANVVITEGLMDTLAARVTWPNAIALGAHGAQRLKDVAKAVAPRVMALGGQIVTVPHRDGGTGEDAMAEAVWTAMKAGLVLDESIHVVDVAPFKDLAEAVQSRRWRAPWPI